MKLYLLANMAVGVWYIFAGLAQLVDHPGPDEISRLLRRMLVQAVCFVWALVLFVLLVRGGCQ